MARNTNQKQVKKTKKVVTEDKSYESPSEKWWGKAFIWAIIIGMTLSVVGGAIFLIIDLFK